MASFNRKPYIPLQSLQQETSQDPNNDRAMKMKSIKVIQNKLNTWKTYIVYLLPVVCTVILLYINFARLYWFPIGGIGTEDEITPRISSNNILNSLQLAAKLYEILVIASLAAIVLETYRLHLVSKGIPFALLTGAYRVFDVMYLLNPIFWRAAPRAALLAGLLILSVLLCTLAGPASAILIIPKLGWFPLPKAFSNIFMPLLIAPSIAVWPSTLNGTLWEKSSKTFCQGVDGSYTYYCPASGLADIYTWTSGWTFSGLRNNITFEDPSGKGSRRLDMWADDSRGTFISGPTSLTTTTLGQFANYFTHWDIGRISHTDSYRLRLSPSSVSYQPLVNAKCNIWNLGNFQNTSQFPDMRQPSEELNCFSANPEDLCTRIRDTMSDWKLPEELFQSQTLFTLFEVVSGKEGTNRANVSSLIFRARLPYYYRGEMGTRMAACSFMAHWIPSSVLLDSTNSIQLRSNITDLSIFGDEREWKKNYGGAMAIQIQRSWLPYLDLGNISTQSPDNDSGNILNINRTEGFENIIHMLTPFLGMAWIGNANETIYFGPGSTDDNASFEDSDHEVQLTLEKFTGTIVADAIARTAAYADAYLVRPSTKHKGSIILNSLANRTGTGMLESQVFANGTGKKGGTLVDAGGTPQELMEAWKRQLYTMDVEAERFGYGYGIHGSSGIFALTVILTYVVVLLVYWVVTLCRRTSSVAALGDLQDLVALAWRSATPHSLRRQGIDMENESLWQESVVVRATSSRFVTMALDEDKEQMQLVRLRKGEEYF